MRQLHTKSGTTQRFSNFALEIRKAIARANTHNRIPGYFLEVTKNANGEEIVSGTPRTNLPVDHPAFQPKKFARRRLGPHGMNPPQWDNRPFAELVKGKGRRKPTPNKQ